MMDKKEFEKNYFIRTFPFLDDFSKYAFVAP